MKSEIASFTKQIEDLKLSELNKDLENKSLVLKLSQTDLKLNRLDEEKSRLERDMQYFQSHESVNTEPSTNGQRQRPERQSVAEIDIEEGLGPLLVSFRGNIIVTEDI